MTDRLEREVQWLATTAGVYTVDDVVLFRASGDAREWWKLVAPDAGALDAGVASQTAIADRGKQRVGDGIAYDLAPDQLVGAAEGDRVLAVPASSAGAVETALLASLGDRRISLRRADDLAIVRAAGPRSDEVASAVIVPSVGSFATMRDGISGRDWLIADADRERVKTELVEAAEAIGGGAVSRAAIDAARDQSARGDAR